MVRLLPTGCRSLDEVLGGGFRFGTVSLIYGEAATGKTTLALSCVVNHLRGDPAGKAFYIDADQRLSTNRLLQIAGSDAGLLDRLLIWRPRSFSEQTAIIEGLPAILARGAAPVVADPITELYRLEAGDAERTFAANKGLNRQLAFLSETAKTRGAAVLLVGQVHSVLGSEPAQVEPVAQRLLRYWSDAVIKLEGTEQPGVRQAVLEGPDAQKACRFSLSEAGLTDVDRPW